MSDTFDHCFDAMEQRDSLAAEGHYHNETKTCRYCGAKGLHWDKTDRGWRLFADDGEMHSCQRTALPLPTRRSRTTARLNANGHRIVDEDGTLVAKVVASSGVGLSQEEIGEMRREEMRLAKLLAKAPELQTALASLLVSRSRANIVAAQELLRALSAPPANNQKES